MTDDTTAAAVKAAAEAMLAWSDAWPHMGEATGDAYVARRHAEAAVTAAAPILLAPVEARLDEALTAQTFARTDLLAAVRDDAVAAERRRIAEAIRAEALYVAPSEWANGMVAAARIAEGETSTIRDADPGDSQDARAARLSAQSLLVDPECLRRNPGLDDYRPSCCRWPKSCSPYVRFLTDAGDDAEGDDRG